MDDQNVALPSPEMRRKSLAMVLGIDENMILEIANLIMIDLIGQLCDSAVVVQFNPRADFDIPN